jgi:hypothetical protein
MSEGYLTDLIQGILAEHGEMSAHHLSVVLRVATKRQIPVGNVCVLLKTRKCFGQNHKTGLWGLRDG